MDKEIVNFSIYLENRKASDELKFYSNPVIEKAYYVGAYANAVILSSYHSSVSLKNKTFKNWLSNQIINYRNLDRIFEMAFRFEQKLKLKLRNDSEVRRLAHETTVSGKIGISSAQVSFAFVAGFDDYKQFIVKNKTDKK